MDHLRARHCGDGEVLAERWINASCAAGEISIASVEDFAPVNYDGLAQAVRLDVGDERVELLALHQGEDVGERTEFKLRLAAIGRRGYIRHRHVPFAGVRAGTPPRHFHARGTGSFG